MNFSGEPAEIKYNYITDFNGNGIKMDVTVSAESAAGGTEIGSDSVDCNLSRNEELGSRKYLIPLLFILAFELLKNRCSRRCDRKIHYS